ncbi:MAG TPA: hypothetical protein VF247_10400 [Candidatus Krumholzibacteria bacterium]
MKLVAPLFLALVILSGAPGTSRAIDELAAQERVGFRAGGLITDDGFNDAYGGGWSLTLFFTERIAKPLLLDIRLGALYFGDLKFSDLDDELTNTPGIEGSMRILYFSAGPLFGKPITDATAVYGSAAVGIYSISMQFDTGVTAYDFSDQKLGFNGGLGVVRRLGAKWSFDVNGSVHYVVIDKDLSDLYYAFTDGADAPLIIDIAAGLTLDLR